MIDTHAHLYLKDFKPDLSDVIGRFQEQGIEHVYLPNIDHESIDDMLELEERYPQWFTAMIGLHPCSVKKDFERELYLVEHWLGQREFVAIGEIGIDLYWDTSTLEYQKEAFRVQVSWAIEKQRPIVIHCRESLDQTIELLESLHQPGLTGVFHCFTGGQEQAQRIIDLGFYLGIGGVVTFKNAGLDGTLEGLPMSSLVLETDSPYLAPVPFRGKRNEPSFLQYIAQRIAEIKDLDLTEVAKITTKNAQQLFTQII